MSPCAAFLAAVLAALQAQDGGGIRWEENLQEALARARRTRKPVVAGFGAAWCASCRKFREETLASAEVRSMARKFHWVRVDVDRSLSLARAHRVKAIPTILLLDPDGATRVRLAGFFAPGPFRRHLESFLSDLDGRPSVDGGASVTIRARDHTPLTWSPDGYRGLSICFSNVGYGVLDLPSQSPFQALRSGFKPRTPSTLAEGGVEARVTGTWINQWAFERDDYRLDFETFRAGFSMAYGITDTFELDVEWTEKSRFGGSMDHLIQGFHDAAGISQGRRDEFSKGDFAFEIAGDGGEPAVSLRRRDRGAFAREAQVSLQHNLTCGTEETPALSYSVTLRTGGDPAGDFEGGSPVDVALSLAAAKRFGEVYAYAGLGFAWFGKERFREVELATTQASLLLALEWRLGARQSILLQYLGSENVIEGPGPFGRPSSEITLGWKRELEPGVVLEAGLVENFVLMDNSPDLGFHAGLTTRF